MNNVKLGFREDFIIHKKIKHYKYVEDIINNFTDKQLENMSLDFLQDLEKSQI
jgi:hypothetical protein